MTPFECEFEVDALSAAVQSRWPNRVDATLRAHIETCAICSDVVAIASAVDQVREAMRPAIPDSGRVWWLAQMRARREAAEAAGRPITAAQVVAFACAVGLLGACFGATSTWFQSALQWIGSDQAKALLTHHVALIAAMAAVILLVPTAVYFALGRD